MLYTLFISDVSGRASELIAMDVVSGFDEKYSANIPEAVVESGYNVSDTINLSSPTFSLSGAITDSKFRVSGHLVRYVNGEFVKDPIDASPSVIALDKPSIVIRQRLIDLYKNKEVFGILEYTDSDQPESSQVRVIYPCALQDVSFSYSDASDAIYPSLTIKNIRVATVAFKEVKNAVPDLIPLVEGHLNAGNATGASGSIKDGDDGNGADEIAKAKALLAKQAKDAKEATKQAVGEENFGGNAGAHAELRKDMTHTAGQIKAEQAYRASNTTDTKEKYLNDYMNQWDKSTEGRNLK